VTCAFFQLEALLNKKDDVIAFLQSTEAAEAPQICSVKFEPVLRRIAFQVHFLQVQFYYMMFSV